MDSTERKLKYFTEVIQREVETQKKHATHKIANEISNSVATALSTAEIKSHIRIESVRREIGRTTNKKIAMATAVFKSQYVNKRDELVNRLFEDVKIDLLDFTRSTKYSDYILQKINATKKGFSIVVLCPRDMHLSELILKETGLTTESGKNDIIGGFVLIAKNRRVQVDYTFKTQLEIARKEFFYDNDDNDE